MVPTPNVPIKIKAKVIALILIPLVYEGDAKPQQQAHSAKKDGFQLWLKDAQCAKGGNSSAL